MSQFYIEKISKMIDTKKQAISEIENEGIVFIDEIDKIAMPNVILIILIARIRSLRAAIPAAREFKETCFL